MPSSVGSSSSKLCPTCGTGCCKAFFSVQVPCLSRDHFAFRTDVTDHELVSLSIRRIVATTAAVLVVVASACSNTQRYNETPVGKITTDPEVFRDSIVRIRGVAKRIGIFFNHYTLRDTSGEIRVVADSPVLSGSSLEITGRVQYFRVPGIVETSPFIIEEQRRTTSR